MPRSVLPRLLAPMAEIRDEEIRSAILMFVYALLLMISYNIVQPLTRSRLIADLGAVNIPYVLFVSSLIIGVLMVGYTRVVSLLPRAWALPIVQTAMAAVMVGFWALFQTGAEWVSAAFYLWGLILAILLISQFWTLANGIYDPRQAKRLFGFIGGGVTLGGAVGAWTTAFMVEIVGTNTLLLWSAAVLLAGVVVVSLILRTEHPTVEVADAVAEEKGIGLHRALELLRGSRHVKLIALVIGFGSVGAALIDQQLNMATEIFRGAGQVDAMGAFLAQVRGWLSLVAFVLQVWVTPRIHRHLGIAFALMLLPTGLVATATIILLAGALWAPAVASVLDRSVRYTVDKTTREVLFLPLPTELRQEVKPFVDVTGDRLSRGLIALVMLGLIQPWGLALRWYQLSIVSLMLAAAWFVLAVRAKREYLAGFRRGIERRDVVPAEGPLRVADLTTIETLMEELASPDEHRVVYAMDLLESLERRRLITPLLLYHESPRVRARALAALGTARSDIVERWLPIVERMMGDANPEVRAAAVGALADIRGEHATDLIRPYLEDRDPRMATTAAAVLARSGREDDVAAAVAAFTRLAEDNRESAISARREVAAAIGHIADPRVSHLLIPLLYDSSAEVAEEAMRSVQRLGTADFLFVPTLVSLLRNRRLKSAARDVLVGYGEGVVDTLGYLLRSSEEDIWVRRHLPATLARIPCQKTMGILIGSLDEPDRFLRFKVVAAIERLRREHPGLSFDRPPIEKLVLSEALRYFEYVSLHHNLFERAHLSKDTLLARSLDEKRRRSVDRIYRLLGLIYPWKDVEAARWAIEHGSGRTKASAVEYLDNVLTGPIRQRVLPILEDLPDDERVRRAHVILKSRPRDVEHTLLQLINDEDQVIAALAIHLVEQRALWALADDIEHVLAYRDVSDHYVFEAASWALAARRMPEDTRRSLWLEPLPTVELADRLRTMPLFASVTIDELFRMAGAGRQTRHQPGRAIHQEGSPAEGVQLLLDGRLALTDRAGMSQEIRAPAVLGFEEVLAGSALRQTAQALDSSALLTITTEEFLTLLSDNTELVEGLFRTLLSDPHFRTNLVIAGGAAADAFAPEAAGGLTGIEKALVLSRIPLFATAAADDLLAIAAIARETALVDGAVLFKENEPPALYALVQGRLSLESEEHGSVEAEASDAVAVYETLAGTPTGRRAQVRQPGTALRIDRDELFDLLGHSPTLLQDLFRALFRSKVAGPML